MDENIMKVHVVETDPNYVEQVKGAVIAGVVTVLATAATNYVLHSLTARAKRRQDEKILKIEEPKKTEE